MTDSWKHAIITHKQFKEIDDWVFAKYQTSKTLDPLMSGDYCVLIRKTSGWNREVIFSPNSFSQLCRMQPAFLALNIKEVPIPKVDNPPVDERSFVFWFGDINHFSEIFPPIVED